MPKMDDIAKKLEAMECGQAVREKYWGECSIEEKIERVRQEVKGLQRSVEEIHGMVSRLVEHQHAPNGNILIPYHQGGLEQRMSLYGRSHYEPPRDDVRF